MVTLKTANQVTSLSSTTLPCLVSPGLGATHFYPPHYSPSIPPSHSLSPSFSPSQFFLSSPVCLTSMSHIYVSPSHAPPRSSLNSFPLCLTSVCLQRSFLLSISPTRPFLSTFHPVLSSLRRGSEEGGASLSAVRVPRLIWP